MRVLGLDLGAKRIGVAISDSDRKVATPIEVVPRTARARRSGNRAGNEDRAAVHRAIAALVEEWEAGLVVVGLPLSLSGEVGPAASGVLDEVAQLRATLSVPVETYDERLTTVTADRSLMEQGLRADERRRVVDKVAAAVLLQAWLDAAGDR